MSIIYKITNKISGKSYIGQTKRSLEERWAEHIKKTRQKRTENIYFYNALKKYRKDSWKLEILEETNISNEREKYWIAYYNTFKDGYNSTIGGEGGGGPHSDATKKKISLAKQGKMIGKDNPMFGVPSPMTGKKHTIQSIEKIRQAKLGVKRSKEFCEKASKNHWNTKGKNNPMFGSTFQWITNGLINKRHKEGCIPEGFKKGKTDKRYIK